MRKFYKFIVFIGLLVQFCFAYGANQDTTISSKKNNSTSYSKESISLPHFVQPSVERSNPDLKHNYRIPVNASNATIAVGLLYFPVKARNTKIVLSDQDIDRCAKVSILLFPYHIFL